MLRIKNHQGISLFELLIILSIAIILALVAIPTFISLVQSHRLASTAENLYYALQYARSEAIKRNTTVYVSYQTGDSWCYGINSGSSCNCSIANNCGLATYSAPASQQLSLSATGFTGNALQFEGTHGAANVSGTLTFTIYGKSTLITITVGRLGNLQTCATGLSGYTAC